ncbi:MAG: mitofilin family membrane protein, partial [Pseudomonadota bacterium]
AVARAFAASSLKSAVDRGGAFGTELEAFATVAEDGDNEAVMTLRNFASGGVPTLSQLVDAYPAVANAIIASERSLNEDAGIGQRLLNNMQGLVSVRPVDEQVGDTPTAVSTRIGARLREGDLSAALDEWEALPGSAKAASQSFVDQVRARQTVDGLLSNILTSAMSGTASPQ